MSSATLKQSQFSKTLTERKEQAQRALDAQSTLDLRLVSVILLLLLIGVVMV